MWSKNVKTIFNLTDKAINGWTIGISLIYILLSAVLMYLDNWAMALLPVGIFIGYMAFYKLDWLLMGVVACIPLSVELRFIIPDLPIDMYLPTEPLIVGIMVLFVMKWIHEGTFDHRIINHPISIAMFIYVGWLIVAASASTMPVVSFKYILSRFWFFAVFFLVTSQFFRKKKNIQTFVWLYSISLIAVIAYSITRLAEVGLTDHQFANKNCWPFYADHTSYGAVLVMLLPVLIVFLLVNKKASNTQRFFHLIVILIYIAATVLSYTRAAWLTLILACGVGLLIHWRIKFWTVLVAAGAIVAFVFAFQTEIYFMLNDNKQDSASDLSKHLESAYNVKTDASNVERINRWNCAIRMFEERPLFGYGPGTYQFSYAPFQHARERTIISTNFGTLGNAHSEYLGTLSESGLPGMLALIWLFIATFLTGVRVYRKSLDKKTRMIAMSLLLGLVTYIFHAYLNNFLDTDKVASLFWGFAAALVAYEVYHIPEEKIQKKEDELKEVNSEYGNIVK